MGSQKPECEDCYYFRELVPECEDTGYCMYNAPNLTWKNKNFEDYQLDICSIRPRVFKDDFCSKYKPND